MVIGIARKLISIFFVLMAAAVAMNLILTPVYHDGSPDYPVWEVLNWFMAVTVFIILVASCLQRLAVGKDANTFDRLRVSLTFYGAIALTMLFFWEWLWTLNSDSETGDAVTSHIIYFPMVDALLSVLALTIGRHLWSDEGS